MYLFQVDDKFKFELNNDWAAKFNEHAPNASQGEK
jgi:hypothetical protein